MNDPRKALNVNSSSLLSLKAELIRKKNEVILAKEEQSNVEDFGPSTSKKMALKEPVDNENDDKKAKDGEVFETEDSLLLEKSRRVLEAKSKFYDQMTRSGGGLNTDDNCLVMFNRKHQEEGDGVGPSQRESPVMRFSETDDRKVEKSKITVTDVDMEEKKEKEKTKEEGKEKSISDSDKEEDDDDDWVDYTDCLGRTRKCLRKDLAECMRRDKDLREGISSETKKPYWMIDMTETDSKDRKTINLANVIAPTMLKKERTLSNFSMADLVTPKNAMPKTKMEEQRAAWEIKEQENLEKIDLHYQDVFFNEARLHGVSYFEFSTDPEERKKQQKELMAARRETLKQQSNYQKIKEKREKLMKNRLFLARNRSRQREGMKPFTWREFEDDYNKNKLAPIEIQAIDPVEELRKWKERQAKTRLEVLQELDRRARIRPWDMGKKDVNGNEFNVGLANIDGGWRYIRERLPMSQEEWNEKMRAERKPEFAPMTEPKAKSKSQIKPKRTNFTCIPSLTSKPITGDFIPLQSTKPMFQKRSYEGADDEKEEENDKEASKSSQSSSDSDSDSSSDSSDSDSDTNSDSDSDSDTDTSESPDHGNRPKQHNGVDVNLETSIDAGLKFLREQSDKGNKGTKASWTSNADY